MCCIRLARPSTNSSLTTFLVTTWCPECRYWSVSRAMLLQRSGSPSRKTLSQGTNTLSKNARASISSNRDQADGRSGNARDQSSRGRGTSDPACCRGWQRAKDVVPAAPDGSR